MKITSVLFCAALAAAALPAVAGTIEGTVVNTSTGTPVPCQAAVVLQVQVKGEFVPFRDDISDKQGRFRFERLPGTGSSTRPAPPGTASSTPARGSA